MENLVHNKKVRVFLKRVVTTLLKHDHGRKFNNSEVLNLFYFVKSISSRVNNSSFQDCFLQMNPDPKKANSNLNLLYAYLGDHCGMNIQGILKEKVASGDAGAVTRLYVCIFLFFLFEVDDASFLQKDSDCFQSTVDWVNGFISSSLKKKWKRLQLSRESLNSSFLRTLVQLCECLSSDDFQRPSEDIAEKKRVRLCMEYLSTKSRKFVPIFLFPEIGKRFSGEFETIFVCCTYFQYIKLYVEDKARRIKKKVKKNMEMKEVSMSMSVPRSGNLRVFEKNGAKKAREEEKILREPAAPAAAAVVEEVKKKELPMEKQPVQSPDKAEIEKVEDEQKESPTVKLEEEKEDENQSEDEDEGGEEEEEEEKVEVVESKVEKDVAEDSVNEEGENEEQEQEDKPSTASPPVTVPGAGPSDVVFTVIFDKKKGKMVITDEYIAVDESYKIYYDKIDQFFKLGDDGSKDFSIGVKGENGEHHFRILGDVERFETEILEKMEELDGELLSDETDSETDEDESGDETD